MPRFFILTGKLKRFLWLLTAVGCLVFLFYLLRWPLMGGMIRRGIEKRVSETLHAKVVWGDLGGSLVSSLHASGLSLEGEGKSPWGRASFEWIKVEYGFLGLAPPRVTARGVRVELFPSDSSPRPPQEILRDALFGLEGLRRAAQIDLTDGILRLADGTTAEIDRVSFQKGRLSAILGWPRVGTVSLSAQTGEKHAFEAEAQRAEGSPEWIRITLAGGDEIEHALAFEARVRGRIFAGSGTARFDAHDRLVEVVGSIPGSQGRILGRLDARSGAAEINVDGEFPLGPWLDAKVIAQGQARGFLAEPLREWRVSSGLIKLSGALRGGNPVSGELRFSEGTLARLALSARLDSGGDRAEAEGSLSLESPWRLELGVSAEIRDLGAYHFLLPESLSSLQARELRFVGQLTTRPEGHALEGDFWMGPGSIGELSWTSAEVLFRATPQKLNLRRLGVRGLPGLPDLELAGIARAEEPFHRGGLRKLEFEINVSKAEVSLPMGKLVDVRLRGRTDGQGLNLESMEGHLETGHFRAAGRWDFLTPKMPLEIHLSGQNLLVLDDKLWRLRVSPRVELSGDSVRGWSLEGKVEVASGYCYGELSGQDARSGKPAEAAAAPKLRLVQAPGGGFRLPVALGGGDRVALNLEMATRQPLRMENTTLGTLVEGEARLGGTLSRPVLSGVFRTQKGEVKLATGVYLLIETAEVTLPAERGQPGTIYFRGRSGKGEGAILVVVTGPIENPSVSLSSNPPRKQEELLAFLAFGSLPGSVTGQQVLGVAARKVFDSVTHPWPLAEPPEGGFWQQLNLSVDSEEAPNPAMRTPWQLPPTSTARGTIIRTEYLLNSFLSVVVDSDREANVSGDLKIRFHFR